MPMYSDVNNSIFVGDVVGPYGGMTNASYVTDQEDDTNGVIMDSPEATASSGKMIAGQPLNWWVICILLFAALIFGARQLNGGDSFGNNFKQIKPSVYNIVLITLAVVIGLPLLKIVAAKLPFAGLRTFILAV